ncbi:aminoglycoside 6'-N-acetyltransferase [Sphingobium olei]|uniref:Aminoglycoside N(6')-acetyltransferase type 1 n=1 Tax=Sphingobium olei TaxID=420955 RepID=A0ABW3P395_9SPHN
MERWALLRQGLWPEQLLAEHREEVLDMLRAGSPDAIAFLALDAMGMVMGLAEAAVRRDYVNGCDTSPVAFLEGIFVDSAVRRSGCAQALVNAVIQWGRERGCTELASDADIANQASHEFHQAVGFAETERVVYFRQPIG